MAKGGNRSNPTAVRTAGGGRLFGQRTVGAMGRIRRARGGGLMGLAEQARENYRRAARRVSGR